MNDISIKVGGIYKLKSDFDATFFRFDHNEKYVIVLSEDYSVGYQVFNVLVYYKEGPKKTDVARWNIRAFDRWELIQ